MICFLQFNIFPIVSLVLFKNACVCFSQVFFLFIFFYWHFCFRRAIVQNGCDSFSESTMRRCFVSVYTVILWLNFLYIKCTVDWGGTHYYYYYCINVIIITDFFLYWTFCCRGEKCAECLLFVVVKILPPWTRKSCKVSVLVRLWCRKKKLHETSTILLYRDYELVEKLLVSTRIEPQHPMNSWGKHVIVQLLKSA